MENIPFSPRFSSPPINLTPAKSTGGILRVWLHVRAGVPITNMRGGHSLLPKILAVFH